MVSGGAGFETTIETTEGSVLWKAAASARKGDFPSRRSRVREPLVRFGRLPPDCTDPAWQGFRLAASRGAPRRDASLCRRGATRVSHRWCVAGGWPPITPRERSTHSSIFAANAYTRGRGSSTARSAAGSAVALGSGSRSRAPSFAHADVQQNVGYAVYLHAGAACRGADALTAVARRPPTRCAPTRRRF